VFGCFDGKHLQSAAVEVIPVALVNRDAIVEESSLKSAREYYEVLEQIEEHFKIKGRHPGKNVKRLAPMRHFFACWSRHLPTELSVICYW